MSDSTEKTARRWRDDPLSVFLAIAAVVLGIMYLVEQQDLASLDDASAKAHELGVRLALTDCTTGSASTDGNVLVIECSAPAADAATRVAAKSVPLDGFAGVLLAGTDSLLKCPPQTSQWPQSCTSLPRPSGKGAQLRK